MPFALMRSVLSFLLPCPICPSPPPSSPFYSPTCEYLIPQCRPQSSALWLAPRQDPVTPSMTSWFSLRSASWKPMESKSTFFTALIPQHASLDISLYLQVQTIDLYPLNIAALAFIALITSLFPATSLLLWTTEAGCPATARSSYIRSGCGPSFILDWKISKFIFVPPCEVVNNKRITRTR